MLSASTKRTENPAQLFRAHMRQTAVQPALARENLIISMFAFPRSEPLRKRAEEILWILDKGL